jgi:predicted nucleotidyltransferase
MIATNSKFQQYKITALCRQVQEKHLCYKRWKQSLQVAQEAAIFLKQHFQVKKVICFGSILHSDRFTLVSDIDLATEGLDPEQFFRAVAELQDLSPEFKIDLVDIDYCRSSLRNAILLEGKIL